MVLNNGMEFPEENSELVEDESIQLDDGWWASILTEDEQFTDSQMEIGSQVNHKSQSFSVDWDRISGLHARDEIIELEVQGFNRGGLLVMGDQIQGFVPISHLVDYPNEFDEAHKDQTLKKFIGTKLSLKVIECDPAQERVVLSERAALAGEGCRKRIFQELKSGDVICGEVTNITDFGVFVDMGGVEGLVHVSELSWGRVHHPQDVLQLGQKIDAQVLQVTEETERVALSYKRLFPNPWNILVDCYEPGDITCATITSIMRFGAFARMKEGVEGLIHISSLDSCSSKEDIEKLLCPGQEVDVKILHIDVNRRRLGLTFLDAE